MKLASILSKDLINLNLMATNKDAAFKELVEMACQKHSGLNYTQVLNSIKEREAQQSTYLGQSLAMPHARIDSLNDFIIVCARSDHGVVFEETNDKVHFFVMILSCKTKINTLLQTMGALATFFSNNGLVSALRKASDSDAFLKVVEKSNLSIKQTLVAQDIMQDSVITLSLQQTLKEVIDIFFSKNVSGCPVLNADGTVAGVVTEKDIINIGIPKYMSMMDNISFLNEFEPFEEIFKKEDQITVKDIYSKDYTFVHNEVSVIQLAFHFVSKSCRRILVLNDDKTLSGLIMRKDLIRKVIHA